MNRTSLQQLKLLFELQKTPANSVTELAKRVGKLRPSVSRSLKVLQQRNLVTYEERQWTITQIGQEEANRSKENLQDTMARFQHSLTTLVPQTPMPIVSVGPLQALESLASVGRIDHVPAFAALQQTSVKAFRNAFAALQQSLVEDFRKAMEPLALAQIQNAARIKAVLTAQIGLDIAPALQALNRGLASTIDDGIALSSFASTRLADRSWSYLSSFPPVSGQLPAITEAVEALNRQMPSAVEVSRMSATSDILIPVVTPTTATAAYTRSLRPLARRRLESWTS